MGAASIAPFLERGLAGILEVLAACILCAVSSRLVSLLSEIGGRGGIERDLKLLESLESAAEGAYERAVAARLRRSIFKRVETGLDRPARLREGASRFAWSHIGMWVALTELSLIWGIPALVKRDPMLNAHLLVLIPLAALLDRKIRGDPDSWIHRRLSRKAEDDEPAMDEEERKGEENQKDGQPAHLASNRRHVMDGIHVREAIMQQGPHRDGTA